MKPRPWSRVLPSDILFRSYHAKMIDSVAISLTIFYCILFMIGLYQLIQVILSNNKKKSSKNIILTFLTIGSLLRVIFWIKVSIPTTVSDRIMIVLFFLPLWFNFAGLSGLAVFYAKALDLAQVYRQIPMRISVILNIILLLLNFAISITITNDGISRDVKILGILYTAYATCLDILLSAVLGYLGNRFIYSPAMKSILPQSIQAFGIVNWIVVICYTFRGIFTPIMLILPSAYSAIEFNGHHKTTSILIFFFFLFAEFLPNFCVMMLLWKVSGMKQHKYASFTVKSLDRFLDINSTSPMHNDIDGDHDSGNLIRVEELITALIADDDRNASHETISHHVSWQHKDAFHPHDNEPLIHDNDSQHDNESIFESSSYPTSSNLTSALRHPPSRQLPLDHHMLADDAAGSNIILSTPSPQLIQVGTSFESSPGGAEFMWQQIYSHQNTTVISSSPNGVKSALHASSPPKYDPRRSFQSDRGSESTKKAAVASEPSERYGNFLSPRDILLMTPDNIPTSTSNKSTKK